MLNKIIVVIALLAILLMVAMFIGEMVTESQLKKDVKTLFSLSQNISNKTYSSGQLEQLPEPVRRYFRYSLQENQSYISYVRLMHDGKFRIKPGQKWMTIKGEEYFTTEKPNFVWFGKVPMFSAMDTYMDGKGNLKVKLLSLIKIVDAKGKEIDQGELLRWLGEALWFPTALLPSENLRWEEVDENSARVILEDGNISVEGTFYFNQEGQIVQFKAKRFKDGVLENWSGFYHDYREVEGMKVPMHVEVIWNLESGDFKYVDFTVKKIEYDVPIKF